MELTSPNKTASVPQKGGGIYYGKITSVEVGEIFVEIPGVAPEFSFGPCRHVAPPRSDQVELEIESVLDGSTVTSTATPSSFGFLGDLQVDDEVVCAFIANGLDEVVILGRLA